VFPAVVLHLVPKCNKELRDPATGQVIDVLTAPYFSSAYCPPSLQRVISLFVDRCYNMWTEQSVCAAAFGYVPPPPPPPHDVCLTTSVILMV
jgi:hypothetical protein